jgi:hypothetical protein
MSDLSRALLTLRAEMQKVGINPEITIELASVDDASRLYGACAAAAASYLPSGFLIRYLGFSFRYATPDPVRVFVDQEIGPAAGEAEGPKPPSGALEAAGAS